MKAEQEEPLPRARRVEVAVQGIPMPRWRQALVRFSARVLARIDAEGWDVSLLLCNDERMAQLNSRYRGGQGPTDVLSFGREARRGARRKPLANVAGDIAVSLETMRRNARRLGASDDEELKRLVVHGILHLAGMDHGSGRGKEMLSLQEQLLARLKEERIIPS